MKSFVGWVSDLKENKVVSKNMSSKDFEEIMRKMVGVRRELEEAIEDWKATGNVALNGARSAAVPMQDLTEWQVRIGQLAEQLEIIKDDISAGPESAWNYGGSSEGVA